MADTIKELLGKWSLDTSSWKSAVTDFRSTIKQTAAEDKVRSDKAKGAQADSIQAAYNELGLRKAIEEQATKAVAAEVTKQAAIKATQQAAKEAAAQELEATRKQIIAEQQKADVQKEALLQQQKAAAQAIAFEEAYQAQLKEVARNKAAAAAAYDAAYAAQVSEVRAKRTPSKISQTSDAAYKAQVAEVSKNKSNAYDAAYEAQTSEVARNKNIASAADKAAYDAQVAEVASNKTITAAASDAAYKAQVSEVAKNKTVAVPSTKLDTSAIAERQAQEQLGAEIVAIQNRTNAAAKQAAAERVREINERRIAEEKLGAEIVSIQTRTNAEAKAKEIATNKQVHAEKMAEIAAEREAKQKEAAETRAAAAEARAEAKKVHDEKMAEIKAEREAQLKERKEAAEASERPSISRLLAGPAATAAGGKSTFLGGMLGSAVTGGEFAIGMAAFEGIEHALDSIIEKTKEFIEDSGGLQKVTDTFEKLSKGQGYDSGAFIEDLRQKTHYLVSEIDLLRLANTFMQSGLKVSKEDMTELTAATIGLARSQGQDASAAIQALQRTFLTGGRGAMRLARIVGIQGPQLMAKGFTQTESIAQRQQATFDRMSEVIKKRYAELGEPVLTYTDRLKQVKVITTELYENVAQGAVKSAGFSSFMDMLGQMIEKLGGMEGIATKAGEYIGGAFGVITAGVRALIPVVSDLWGILTQVVSYIFDFGKGMTEVGDKVDATKDKVHQLHPVLDDISTIFFDISNNIEKMINSLSDLIDMLPKAAEAGKKFAAPYKAIGDYILHDVLNIDTSKLRSGDSDNTADPSRLRTSEGKVLGSEDASKAKQWEEDTTKEIKKHSDEGARKSIKVSDDQRSGKITDEEAKKRLAEITQDLNESILNTKQDNAAELNLKYKPSNADIDVNSVKQRREFKDSLQELGSSGSAKPTIPKNDPALELRHRRELEQAELSEAKKHVSELKKLASEQLEDAKSKISDEQTANEQLYKLGKEQAKEYYQSKRDYARETYDASIANISAEDAAQRLDYAAQRKKLKQQLDATEIFPDVYAKNIKGLADEEKGLTHDTTRKKEAATKTLNKEVQGVNLSEGEDQLNADIKIIDLRLDAKKKANALETASTKDAFDNQYLSASDYLEKSKTLIQEELAATVVAETHKQQLEKQTEVAKVQSQKIVQQAREVAQQKLSALDRNAIELNIKDSTAQYQNKTDVLQGQLTAAQNPSSGGIVATPTSTISKQIALMEQLREANLLYAEDQQKLLLDPSVGLYSAQWKQIQDNIQGAQQKVIQLDDTIRGLQNPENVIGSTLGAAAQAGQGFLTSRYARGVLSAVQGGAASNESAQGQVDQITSGFGGIKDAKNPTDMLDSFSKGLKGAVGALGSFVNSISNAGSASAGALGGGMSGAGLGQAAGSAAQALAPAGSAISSLGSAAGPIGAVIGAALGAVMGGIMGHKQEMVQDDINQLTANFKVIMNNYSSNNASLAQTVKNLEALIAQAQADQASTKKGGTQFADLIKQYNDQIVQLEAQQQQIMSQLNNQLIQISSPQAYQPLISSIQDILSQYTSFVGAAQSATELANANNYLTQSLQNLATGYTQTLQQDQINAIQEALTLNQLYNQRNQLEMQYLQQVRSIQGQGTITRGVTLAQSKFSQLYNLDVNQANQLDAINQQINLAQYQVQAAQQVFQLATTKAGLEAQLLGLQEQGINLDMSRISAMQNVLQLLATTGYSLTNLGGLNTSDPNALLTLLLQILAGSLGVNPGGANSAPSGASPLDTHTAAAYSQRSSYGYASFRSANL